MRVEDILNIKDKQKVYDKYPYFPTHLITEDEDECWNFVIGTGGDGKTFGELCNAIDMYEEGGLKNQSAFIYPTKDEVKTIIDAQNLFDKLYEDEETAEKYSYFIENLTYKGDWIYYNGKPFVRLYAISQHYKYKPETHTRIGNIWMDEFEREKYLKNESFKIQDLFSTIIRRKTGMRVSFTANAISLASPILVALDIYEINEDDIITPIYDDDGELVAKVWYWKRPMKDIEKQYEGSVHMRVFKKTGYADYRYGNEFKNDNMRNIMNIEEDDMKESGFNFLYTVRITEDMFVDIYNIPKDVIEYEPDVDGNIRTPQSLWYIKVNKDNNRVITCAIDPDFVQDGVELRSEITDNLHHMIQYDRIWYDSVACKQNTYILVKNNMYM